MRLRSRSNHNYPGENGITCAKHLAVALRLQGNARSLVAPQTWLPVVGMGAAPPLPQLEVVDGRELGVLDAGLPALEVLQIDLGDLHTAVAYQAAEAIDLATALQPGAGEGMAEFDCGGGHLRDALPPPA